MRLLLGSGGFSTPERQAAWKKELSDFLGPIEDVLFVPYALSDHDAYVKAMTEKGFHAGKKLNSIHRFSDPLKAIHEANAIYIGGGNTFRLLNDLYRFDLMPRIRERVRSGELPFVGVSAGTNVATPSIKTTNDMPIVYPPSFDALGLVPFQINPHYFAGAIHIKREQEMIPYGGETRDDRIREFHEMNELPVIGLWEGAMLRMEDGAIALTGGAGARLFRKATNPIDLLPGQNDSELNSLLLSERSPAKSL